MNTKYSGRRIARPGLLVKARVEHRGIPAGTEGYIEGVHGSLSDRHARTIQVRWYHPDAGLRPERPGSNRLIPNYSELYTRDEAPELMHAYECGTAMSEGRMSGKFGYRHYRVNKTYHYQLVVR